MITSTFSGRTRQTSQHQGQGALVQEYSYDRLKRLTGWTEQNESIEFAYDKLGNRQWTFNGTDSSIYSYSTTKRNRLSEMNNGFVQKEFQYNLNGAVTIAWTESPLDTTYEYFSYNPGGSLKSYTQHSGDKLRKWLYRQSPMGGREQKRLIETDIGDTLGRTHAWVYYQLGAGGQQFARWHGRQTSDSVSPAEKGRRVYMYPHSYLTNGGELTAYPDLAKEYHITDAQGTVRQVLRWKEGTLTAKAYDYRPFGDSLAATGELPNQGFANMEQDEESEYIQMGARTYNPALGRFMSVDPLFEAFPGQSAYSYAFNSPLSWSDPSGLAPEKEKKRDRVLYTLTLTDVLLEEAWNRINIEREMEACAEQIMRYDLIARAENWCRNGMGGGGGPGPRLGQSCALVPRGWTMIGGVPTALYSVYIPSSSSDMIKIDLQVNSTSVSNGQTFFSVAQAFANGVNKILSLDAGYFDQLVGHKTTVLIKHSSEIKTSTGKPALGLHTPISPGNSLIELPGDILTGNTIYKYYDVDAPLGTDPTNPFQAYQIIGHEFAHAIHFALAGWNDFTTYHTNIKEYVAGTYENYLNQLNNTPLRDHGYGPPKGISYILNSIFDPNYIKQWEKFYRRGY